MTRARHKLHEFVLGLLGVLVIICLGSVATVVEFVKRHLSPKEPPS